MFNFWNFSMLGFYLYYSVIDRQKSRERFKIISSKKPRKKLSKVDLLL